MGESTQARPIPDIQIFRDAFNASPIGIAVENLDGQPLFVNPALCSMLGFSEEELCGKHCVQFSPPDDAEKDWALFQTLRAGSIDHYQLEKRYFRRDGSLVWGHLSLSSLNHRPSPLVMAMVEDITEKKTADEARFRHAAIVESSEDAIASGTLDGIIVTWNSGAQRMYGYTEAEAVGQPITILLPPELGDEENKILETLRAGGRIEQFETVRVTKTGKRINVSLSISPIRDSSGRIVGVSGIGRDITERKRAEEAFAEMNRTLVAQAALLQERKNCSEFSSRTCRRRSRCSTGICVICRSAIDGVVTIRLKPQRYWGDPARIFPKCLSAGKRPIAALSRGRPYELRRTVGNLEAALVGLDGKFVLGEIPMAQWAEFLFLRRT